MRKTNSRQADSRNARGDGLGVFLSLVSRQDNYGALMRRRGLPEYLPNRADRRRSARC